MTGPSCSVGAGELGTGEDSRRGGDGCCGCSGVYVLLGRAREGSGEFQGPEGSGWEPMGGHGAGGSVMMGEQVGDAGWKEARGDKRWTLIPKEVGGDRLQNTGCFQPGRGRAMLQEGGKASMYDGEMRG